MIRQRSCRDISSPTRIAIGSSGVRKGLRAVTPRSNSVEDCLFHFRQWSRRGLASNFLEALDAKHFSEAVENLEESIGVENRAVTG